MKLGVVSDIHCQYQALELALDAMGRVDQLICAGDAIDQSRFCERTVAILRDRGFVAILGNHENTFFAEALAGRTEVEGSLRTWLYTRPEEVRFRADESSVRVVHATSWDRGFDYVTPSHRSFSRFADCDANIVIYGHTHQPVARMVNDTLIVNPGSVGEGRPDARGFIRSCAVVDCAAREARIIDLD